MEGSGKLNITALVMTNRTFFHSHFIKSPNADQLDSANNYQDYIQLKLLISRFQRDSYRTLCPVISLACSIRMFVSSDLDWRHINYSTARLLPLPASLNEYRHQQSNIYHVQREKLSDKLDQICQCVIRNFQMEEYSSHILDM